MKRSRTSAFTTMNVLLIIILSNVWPTNAAWAKLQPKRKPIVQPLTLHEKVAHLLDRLAFGGRPGDAERIEKSGPIAIQRWITSQLDPESVSDSDLDQKLAGLKAPSMTPEQLLTTYKRPEDIAVSMGIKKEDFQKNEDLKKEIRKKIGEENLPDEIFREMASQKIIRAVESRRQLQEVLADFWLNHFNIDISKGEERWLVPAFERDVIRKHIFGKFADLLEGTAHSPAMLFYLDNQSSQSAIDYSNPKKGPVPRKNGGLNEHYAREILELHTLGVDGGYQQSDVTELARIRTGWSIDDMRTHPVFKFRDKVHDQGEKVFLGQKFEAGHGQDEGERALKIMEESPQTAHFISFKLARYFVSDHPPAQLVDRMAKVFQASHGDLKKVYQLLFSSPEFWSRTAYQAKVKKPFQFVASSVRSLGGELELKNDVFKVLGSMGEESYRCAPPTGYKDVAEVWVNPGAMVSRLGFAMKLSSNRLEGVYVTLPRVEPVPNTSQKLVRQVEFRLLHEKMSENSENVVVHEFQNETRTMADGEVRPLSLSKAAGLILGSPEFQRR
jgi:uncharacterized protein (DUF1800 family)